MLNKPNILLIITDQEREVMHWPEGWAEENLHARNRLKAHGMTFNRAYIATAACSPSRASLFTGLYPAQHGVTRVLQSNDPYSADQVHQTQLSSHTQNMARMLVSAGYNVVYKGKWHLTKPAQFNHNLGHLFWSQLDSDQIAEKYGFTQWNAPDAGDGLLVREFGGGSVNHDGRFVDGSGTAGPIQMSADEMERNSIIHFLNNYDSDKPFCLIASLVNPHDVVSYPGTGRGEPGRMPAYQRGGYSINDFSWLPIDLPETAHEDLITKPKMHRATQRGLNTILGTLKTAEEKRNYCRFYAYLVKESDKHIGRILDGLDANGLTEDTLIVRTSDHGEMGMAHGGLRQKFGYVYEETTHVPLIFSNPKLYPKPQESDALVSLVDVLPTLCTVANVPDREQYDFKGNDLSGLLQDPAAEVQDTVHYTYDDFVLPIRIPYFLRKRNLSRRGGGHIRAIIEKQWKYAVYYDPESGQETEYELYDLENDPLESKNLLNHWFYERSIEAERRRLHQKLIETMQMKGTLPDNFAWPTANEFSLGMRSPTANAKRLFRETIEIEAPAAHVWQTFTDFESIGEWNPLVTSVKGAIRPSNQIDVTVSVIPRPLKATIVKLKPNRAIHWLDKVPGDRVRPCFMFNIEPVGEDKCRVLFEESFEGAIVPLIGNRLERRMTPLYKQMLASLKARCETRQK
ncbi:MAG: sulfatase-like hydrolase/transferase [Chloroflexota bacterium]